MQLMPNMQKVWSFHSCPAVSCKLILPAQVYNEPFSALDEWLGSRQQVPCAEVTLAVVEAGALSTEESSRAARLLAEPFCDEGLLEVFPFVASLSAAVMAAVIAEGSAGLPFRPAKYADVSNLATSFSSCCLYCCAAREVYCT